MQSFHNNYAMKAETFQSLTSKAGWMIIELLYQLRFASQQKYGDEMANDALVVREAGIKIVRNK